MVVFQCVCTHAFKHMSTTHGQLSLYKTLYTPPAQFTTHPGSRGLDIALSFLVTGLNPEDQGSFHSHGFLTDVMPNLETEWAEDRKKVPWTTGGVTASVFLPQTFPVTSLARRPATRVTPESRLVLRSQGCGFCGATTVRKQGPLLSRVFSHRASNHDNSPAEKHPSNPCLLARRHN